MSFNSRGYSSIHLIQKDVTVANNSLEGQQTLKTDFVGFSLTRPDNSLIKALVVNRIHSFPKFNLPINLYKYKYKMDGPYPRWRGEVDLLLGVVDTFRLLSGTT